MATKPPSTPPNRAPSQVWRAPARKSPPPAFVLAHIVPWLYIVGGVLLIAWLLSTATPEKDLKCSLRTGGGNSLLNFGTCSTDDEAPKSTDF